MAATINSILVDDEQYCLSALKQLIERYCPDIRVINTASSVKEAITVIEENKPDLVFLDINLPDGDGFNVLDRTNNKSFEVIFTTAHEEYAIRAFEFSAIHYLLKPIDRTALVEAIERYNNKSHQEPDISQQLEVLKENFNQNNNRIMLPSMEGFSIYEIENIIRCEAEGCYTRFYIKDEEKPILVSNPIGGYEKLFTDLPFCRIHNKHLVNLKHITKYLKSYGGFVVMADGNEVKVSERKKAHLFEKMKSFARGA